MTKISEDGRRLLREAVVHYGATSDLGNKIADFLENHADKAVIEGKSTVQRSNFILQVPDPVEERPRAGVEDLDRLPERPVPVGAAPSDDETEGEEAPVAPPTRARRRRS